jgi:hypothetical protein
MIQEHPRLKLGKRASFVKTTLKRLPRQEGTWAVDFRALPKPADQTDTHYLGLAVALPRGDPLVYLRWHTPRPSTTWPTSWPTPCAGH